MATSMGILKVPIKKVMRNVTVDIRLTGMTSWTWRLRVARAFMQFAMWVAGMGCRVRLEHEKDVSDGGSG